MRSPAGVAAGVEFAHVGADGGFFGRGVGAGLDLDQAEEVVGRLQGDVTTVVRGVVSGATDEGGGSDQGSKGELLHGGVGSMIGRGEGADKSE